MATKSSDQPGAAKFGNFIDYYRFNPADNRLKFMPRDLVERMVGANQCIALDIGCNTGELTSSLFNHFNPCDDSSLTESSSSSIEYSCNQDDKGNIKERCVNGNDLQSCTNNANKQGSLNSVLSNQYGLTEYSNSNCNLCILGVDIDATLIERANEANMYPKNLSFHAVDIMDESCETNQIESYLKEHDRETFDFIFCFSVTMWIHLNHGDEGLHRFLREVCHKTRYLVVEPQPWKCYKSAMRRLRKLKCPEFPSFSNLKMRETVSEDIVNYLESVCDMTLVQQLGVTDWDRKLLLFKSREVK